MKQRVPSSEAALSDRPAPWSGLAALATLLVQACDTSPEAQVSPAPPAPSSPPAGPQAPSPHAEDAGSAQAPSDAMPPTTHAGCAVPLRFDPIIDDGPRTTFTNTEHSNTLDWAMIGLAVRFQAPAQPDRFLALLHRLGGLSFGYPLTLLDHSLQVATRARRDGASDDLVLAALCHRLGMALSIEGYAELSAAMLRGYVSEPAYRVVRHHAEYAQAGAQRRARYVAQPWHPDAVRFVDTWAAPAWSASYDTLPLSAFEALVRAKFDPLHDPYLTRTDCI
jgi:predicted HD phosphohydrolase